MGDKVDKRWVFPRRACSGTLEQSGRLFWSLGSPINQPRIRVRAPGPPGFIINPGPVPAAAAPGQS